MVCKHLPRLILAATLVLMHVSGQESNYYRQKQHYGYNRQRSNYGQNSNYAQSSSYAQNSNNERNSNYGRNAHAHCEQNHRSYSNNSFYERQHQKIRYADYSFTQGHYCCPTNRISKLYTEYLIPDATLIPPRFILDVTFPPYNYVCLGNKLTHNQTQKQPDVNYPTRPGDYHSLFLIDFDASSYPPFVHWWTANIPGGDIMSSTPVFDFVGPNPPRETGWHRYTMMVFTQPGKIFFDMPEIASTNRPPRYNFSLYYWVDKYKFDPQPHAMNYFNLRFDNFSKVAYPE